MENAALYRENLCSKVYNVSTDVLTTVYELNKILNFSLRFPEESVFSEQQKHLSKTKKFRP